MVLLDVILSMSIGFIILIILYMMISTVMSEKLQQERYNNFLSDKDSFYLDLTEALSKADSVNVFNGDIETVQQDMYESKKKITKISATSVYNNGTEKFQEIYEVTDKGDNITSSTNLFLIKDTGELEVVKTTQQSYRTLSDLYAQNLDEVCYKTTAGADACQSISNLIDVIVYSSGISGKSKEHFSRRYVYYD